MDKNVIAINWSNNKHNHPSFLSKLERLYYGWLGEKILEPCQNLSLFLPTEQPKNLFSIPHFLSSLFSHPTKQTLIEDSNYWGTFPHEVYLIFPIKGYCIPWNCSKGKHDFKSGTLLVILCMYSGIFSSGEILMRSVSEELSKVTFICKAGTI